MTFTRQQIRQLRKNNAEHPAHMTPLPREKWPSAALISDHFAHAKCKEVWRSRTHLMMAFDENGYIRLSFQSTDYDQNAGRFRDGITWDDMQRMKGETGFGNLWGVEVFPPIHEVVNVANMRHIWLLPGAPEYVWTKAERK